MATGPVTKIYKLETFGYDQVIRELTDIETKFKSLSQLKKDLNKTKLTSEDADTLLKVNEELEKARLKTKQLQLERQNLINQAKATQNANQTAINQSKAQTSANAIEAGSYQDLYNKQKLLYDLLKKATPGKQNIVFDGQTINFDQAIAEFKRLSAMEQEFRRQFQKDSILIGEYTTGIVNAFKQLGLGDLVNNQITKLTEQARLLDIEFDKLRADLLAIKATGGNFSAIEQALIANRNQAAGLNAQITQLKANMSGMGTIGQQVSAAIGQGFSNIKGQIGSLLVTYLGFHAAFNATLQLIGKNADISDAMANLQIRTQGTRQETNELFEALKRLNTRTSVQGLLEIANVVAKKGGPKEEIIGLTEAFDRMFVVLGKEAGDVSESTASVVKLISIFNEDQHVTADRVNEIATAMIKLTQGGGVATGSFLIDFAERVGAVRGITGLTLPNILGMGAALQQLGQHAEVAGTASIQLTTKLFSDVPKFAAAAKKTVEEYRELLKNNPFDALIATAEGLANLTDEDLARDYEEIVAAFGEVNVTGARIKAVLGDIATNGQLVRDKMKLAAVGTEDYARATEAAELKQQTFAATLDRIKKQFELLGTSKSFQQALIGTSTAILLILTNLQLFIPLFILFIGLTNTAWGATVRLTAVYLLNAAATGIESTQLAIKITRLYLVNTATIAYTALTLRAAAATGLSAVAYRAAAVALGFLMTPLGLAVAALTALAIILGTMRARAQDASRGVEGLTNAQRNLNEANAIAQKELDQTIAKENVLLAVIKDRTLADKTRQLALLDLIKMMGEYGKNLTLETVLTEEGTKAIGRYNEALKQKGIALALDTIATRENNKYNTLIRQQSDVERELAKGKKGVVNSADLEEDVLDVLERRRPSLFRSTKRLLNQEVELTGEDLRVAGEIIKEKLAQQLPKVVDAEITKKEAEVKAGTTIADTVKEAFEVDIPALQKSLDDYNQKIKDFKGSQSELAKTIDLRDAVQEKLNTLLEKQKAKKFDFPYRGARVPGEQKDEISLIEARVKREIALEETRAARLQVVMVDGQKRIHELTYDEENLFNQNIQTILEKGLRDKIAVFERKKTLNAKEKETLSGYYKELADLELKGLKSLQTLNEREFGIRTNELKKQLDASIALIEEAQAVIELDPEISEETKAVKRKAANDKILELNKVYFITLDLLAKKYSINQETIEEEKQKAISTLTRKGLADNLKITEAILRDISKAHERHVAEIQRQYGNLKLEVIQSDKPANRKEADLRRLDREEELTIAASNVARAKIHLDQIKKDVAAGRKQIEDLDKAEADFANASRRYADLIQEGYTSLNNIREGADGFGQALAEAFGLSGDAALLLADAFGVAEDAMNQYFDREFEQIERSNQRAKERIDIETEQMKNRAQSDAERASLDKQAAEKKEKLDREAFEKNKKIQIQQAKVNLAIQLSNIAVAASANPLNPFTFGAAGILQYIIQAAIATAAYLVNVGNIRSAQFEFGGMPKKGGKIGGKPHSQGGTPFTFGGESYEAEVDELAIIRTKNVRSNTIYNVIGTQAQIASKMNVVGGGVEFQPGAKLKRFEVGGILGTNYTPPQYNPSIGGGDNNILITEIRNLANEQSARIDRLEVHQVTESVTKAQRKQVQQTEIGTL